MFRGDPRRIATAPTQAIRRSEEKWTRPLVKSRSRLRTSTSTQIILRFAELQDKRQPVPRDRIVEGGVQDRALKLILAERFEVKQLKDSIRTIGFLTIDRLVVTPLPQDGKFVVIEGNRRLGAVKALLEDHRNGQENLGPEILSSLQKISVLLLEEPDCAKREHLRAYSRVCGTFLASASGGHISKRRSSR